MRRSLATITAVWLCLMLGGVPATAQETLEVDAIEDVPYLEDADGITQSLSVYAPTAGGPWPTAVMIHGAGGSRLDAWAGSVASEGAVVFVPYWPDTSPWETAGEFLAANRDITSQLACAVRFARSQAERYGGDAADLSLFGHSAGATMAADIAFTDPAVPAGCLADAGSAVPEDLVVFEGEWLELGSVPLWDALITEDRAVFDTHTPWAHLADAPRIPVTILDPGGAGALVRTAEEIDRVLALRDPDGRLRDGLERLRALEDEQLTIRETQRLLGDELEGLGHPVTFLDLPASSHDHLGPEALAMLSEVLRSRPASPAAE